MDSPFTAFGDVDEKPIQTRCGPGAAVDMLIGNNWLTKAERDDRKKIGIAIAASWRKRPKQ